MNILILSALIFPLTSIASDSILSPKPVGMFNPHQMVKKFKNQKPDCKQDLDSLSKYAFNASITCQYQCLNKNEIKINTISSDFNPDVENMCTGDGYNSQFPMLASFISKLTNWASKNCLDLASKKCGTLIKVEASDYTRISSGTWEMNEKPSCEQNKKMILSPFDPSYKLAPAKVKFSNIINTNSLTHRTSAPVDLSTCKKPIKGKVCFGDCVYVDEKNPSSAAPLTLMTKTSPVFDDEQAICGDSLVSEISGKNLSKSVIETLCQNFYTSSLIEHKEMGTSCAAFRGSANCNTLIDQFAKKINK